MWIGIIIIIVMAFLFPVFIVLSIKSVERGGRRRSFEDNDGMSPLSPNAYVMPGYDFGGSCSPTTAYVTRLASKNSDRYACLRVLSV